MQIMPTGGAWTNPAAQNQQALGDAKHVAGNKQQANLADPVTPLEETGKASDRDAQERYAGPQHANAAPTSESATEAAQDSMLVLPASDDLEPGTLDLLG
jgi:hypothetical protein